MTDDFQSKINCSGLDCTKKDDPESIARAAETAAECLGVVIWWVNVFLKTQKLVYHYFGAALSVVRPSGGSTQNCDRICVAGLRM